MGIDARLAQPATVCTIDELMVFASVVFIRGGLCSVRQALSELSLESPTVNKDFQVKPPDFRSFDRSLPMVGVPAR